MQNINRIVIVDDDPGILHLLEGVLQTHWSHVYSMEIACFSNPQEALDNLEDATVVISDIKMLPIDGIEFLRRAHEKNSKAHYIVYSAFADSDTEIDLMRLDEDWMLLKSEASFTPVFHKSEYLELARSVVAFLNPRPVKE